VQSFIKICIISHEYQKNKLLNGLTKKAVLQKNWQKTKLKIAISLIKMLRLGPEVSFKGSPTVSPITAALCSSDPFLWTTPSITS